MFSGDIRRNLDPFEQHGDAALWGALESVDLKPTVEAMEGGLQVGGCVRPGLCRGGGACLLQWRASRRCWRLCRASRPPHLRLQTASDPFLPPTS